MTSYSSIGFFQTGFLQFLNELSLRRAQNNSSYPHEHGMVLQNLFLVKLSQHVLLLTSTALGDLSRDCGAQPFDGTKVLLLSIELILHM